MLDLAPAAGAANDLDVLTGMEDINDAAVGPCADIEAGGSLGGECTGGCDGQNRKDCGKDGHVPFGCHKRSPSIKRGFLFRLIGSQAAGEADAPAGRLTGMGGGGCRMGRTSAALWGDLIKAGLNTR
jgi:hypothetical protein